MTHAGLTPPPDIIADGKIHRFDIEGDKPRTKNGWYVLFDDPSAGACGDWKRNIKETWSAKEYQTLSPEEQARHEANMEAAKRAREQEQKRMHAECREACAAIWEQAEPAPADHPYLAAKGVKPHGLKVHKGALLVPVRDGSTLHGLQFIGADGEKRFKSGTDKRGHYHSLGGRPTKVLYLAEGYATAASIHEATGQPVAVCFDAGNLQHVLSALRKKMPKIQMVICADNDRGGDTNTGVTKATEAAQAESALLAIPKFPEGVSGTDFNDLAQACGLEEVRKQVEAAEHLQQLTDRVPEECSSSPYRTIDYTSFLSQQLPERDSIVDPILPAQSLSMIYAPAGTGKTFFLLGLCVSAAAGQPFLCWETPRPVRVVYLDFEMPATAMQQRLAGIVAGMDQPPASDNLRLFTPDLQDPDRPLPDLSTPEGQQEISPLIQDADLIVVDNISSACRTGRENEAEQWIPVQTWALRQRAAGRSVLFVHHAGKGGQQRGSSKKVDLLDLVLSLKRPADYDPTNGAQFEIHVEKGRHLQGDEGKAIEATLNTASDGRHSWLWRTVESSTIEKVAELTREGLSQKEIAEELQINKSSVSRAVKRAKADGLLS
jgi:putative DNA primase/helicase